MVEGGLVYALQHFEIRCYEQRTPLKVGGISWQSTFMAGYSTCAPQMLPVAEKWKK
jgi:hypothetical protein